MTFQDQQLNFMTFQQVFHDLYEPCLLVPCEIDNEYHKAKQRTPLAFGKLYFS